MKTITSILDYINGRASQDNRESLEKWLSENADNKAVFDEIKLIDEYSKDLKDIEILDVDAEWSAFLHKVEAPALKKVEVSNNQEAKVVTLAKKNYTLRYALAAAAAVLVLFAVLFNMPKTFEEVYTTNSAQLVTLDDGSTINLSPNSHLKYPVKFKENTNREVFFNGSATFDITNIPGSNFIVNTALNGIEVLGTTFDVDASDTKSKLGVGEGTCELFPQADKTNKVVLNTGDVIEYTAAGFDTLMIGGVDFKNPPEPEPTPEPVAEPEVVKEEPVIVEEKKDTVVEKVEEEPIAEEEPAGPPRGKFTLGSLMGHLQKMHPDKDKFKIGKKVKYEDSDTIQVSISADIATILSQLEESYIIEYKSDVCEGCFEIIKMTPK